MKAPIFIILFTLFFNTLKAQETSIDGRLKPFLDDFFELCESYGIEYHEKLFKLKRIAIVEDLHTSPEGSVLGLLQRNENNEVENIAINWITMLDQEILKIVAFHEFGHYFLEYKEHVCEDCGIIMARVNSSYFDIAKDWKNQVQILFENSPAYLNLKNGATVIN